MKNFGILLSLLALNSAGTSLALEDVTVMNTTITSGGSQTNSDGYTYENSVQSVNTVSTNAADYSVTSFVDNVFVRRNTTNANQSSTWYASNGPGGNLSGDKQSDYGQMLKKNNVYEGSDNTFSNAAGQTGGNIERLDFTWNSARTSSSALRFGVFDRGLVGVHDSFAIAAVTAIDAFGNPTAYSNLLLVSAGWGGATNAFGNQDYRLFRHDNGDDISTYTDSTGTNNQGIGGVLISMADLGLADGTAVYGYSIMSNDVTDPLNLSSFPTTTDGNSGGGGIDLAALNGIEFQVVPEPSSVLIFLGLAAPMVVALRRRNQRAGLAA